MVDNDAVLSPRAEQVVVPAQRIHPGCVPTQRPDLLAAAHIPDLDLQHSHEALWFTACNFAT